MQSLALKYRPKDFKDLVGQLHAAKSLKNAIEHDQVAHAYVFFGARGVGKTSTARILAKSLNCEQGPTIEPCNICANCVEIAKGENIDVIEMDAASNRGIEHIRELRESVRFAPMKSKHKIYIIDEVHMLTNESFNALLKTLEEPPSHVVFILATTEAHKIPETILSRCQVFSFRKFAAKETLSRLQYILNTEGIKAEDAALSAISQKAEGSMRDAISLLDQVIAYCSGNTITFQDVALVLGLVAPEIMANFLESMRLYDLKSSLIAIEKIYKEGYDLKRFLWDLLEHIRNIFLVREELLTEDNSSLSETELTSLKEAASHWDSHSLNLVFEELFKLHKDWTIFQSSKAAENRIALELALSELMRKLKQPSVAGLLKKIADLGKSIEEGHNYIDKEVAKEEIKPEAPKNISPAQSPETTKKENITTENSASNDAQNVEDTDIESVLQKTFFTSEESSPIKGKIFED